MKIETIKQNYKLQTIFVFVLFLLPTSINAEQINMDMVLGKFFNRNIDSLVFKPTPNIAIFDFSFTKSGNTYIPNPIGGLKPIGPLNLTKIPADALVNLSNFVFMDVER